MIRDLRPALLAETVEAPTLIDAHDLATLMRCDASTVHRMVRAGTFPKPLRDSGMRGFRWFTRDYVEWLKARAPDA